MSTRNVIKSFAAVALTSSLVTVTAHADNEEIIERVKPVGQLVIMQADAPAQETAATVAEANEAAPASAHAGKADYDAACFACHGTGAAGAPILGKKDAWTTRVSQGMDALYTNAIQGFNGMPAKGGAMHLSDDQVKVIVDYMVEQSS
jgi:cytochrome c5